MGGAVELAGEELEVDFLAVVVVLRGGGLVRGVKWLT